MDGGAMLNCLRIALICGVVVALAGCGKKGPLDLPGAPEASQTKFDAKSLIDRKNSRKQKAPPKECKSTFLDPLVGAECPQPQ
jgi:predicted small lipoprotein YifL